MDVGVAGMRTGELRSVTIQLLGELSVKRSGKTLAIPASRKTRAILGYLLLAPNAVPRSRLCDLFFTVPDDPRAALRWSLSKLRPLIDETDNSRLIVERDTVRCDIAGATVDVLELRAAAVRGFASLDQDELERLLALLRGPLLADSDLPDQPEFAAWLVAARADCHALERRLVDALIQRCADSPARLAGLWQRRIAIDPLDEDAYAGLAETLAALGQRDEAVSVVETGERALRAEGLRPTPRLRASVSQGGGSAAARVHGVSIPDSRPVPTVAVMPFSDLSRDPLPAYLADGLVEGIVHNLSKFRSLHVLSRMSTARYRGHVEDPIEIGAQLAADVLVGGCLLASEGHVSIRWNVVETRTGRLVASGDVAHPRDDPAGLSSDAAVHIALAAEPQAQIDALERAMQKPTSSKVAYDFYLQGMYGAFATLDGVDYELATQCFRRALQEDPGFALAAAFLPWAAACANAVRTPDDARELEQIARRAVRTARDDARALAVAGASTVMLTGDVETGIAAVERALRLNPYDHIVVFEAGWIHMVAGEYERPMEYFARAEQLDTTGIAAVGARTCRATCLFLHGETERAEDQVRQALEDTPSNFWNWVIATAIAAERDDRESIARRAAEVLKFAPDGLASQMLARMPYRQAAHRERLISALRSAGIPG